MNKYTTALSTELRCDLLHQLPYVLLRNTAICRPPVTLCQFAFQSLSTLEHFKQWLDLRLVMG